MVAPSTLPFTLTWTVTVPAFALMPGSADAEPPGAAGLRCLAICRQFFLTLAGKIMARNSPRVLCSIISLPDTSR